MSLTSSRARPLLPPAAYGTTRAARNGPGWLVEELEDEADGVDVLGRGAAVVLAGVIGLDPPVRAEHDLGPRLVLLPVPRAVPGVVGDLGLRVGHRRHPPDRDLALDAEPVPEAARDVTIDVASLQVDPIDQPERRRERHPRRHLEQAAVLQRLVAVTVQRPREDVADPHPQVALPRPVRLSQRAADERLERQVEVRTQLPVDVRGLLVP